MYGNGLGSPNCDDPTQFNADCVDTSGGIDWTNVIDTVLTTAGQVINPSIPTRYPIYNPTSTALAQTATQMLPLVALGVAAFLILRKGRH